MQLRRDRIETLYVQIAQEIERSIRDGKHPPFSKLPSEQALGAKYGVSRVTVRQAMAILLKKGLVESKQGKGTFVVGTVLHHGLDRLIGFYDSLVAQGQKPRTRLLEFGPAAAPDRARSVFAAHESPPMGLTRLYLLDERPFAIVRGLLTPDAACVTRAQVERFPIYGILREVLGAEVTHADVGIRACAAGKKNGALLSLAAGRPLLVMERISRDASGRPLEHSWFYVVPDKYEVRLGIAGPLEISKGIRPVAPAKGQAVGPRFHGAPAVAHNTTQRRTHENS